MSPEGGLVAAGGSSDPTLKIFRVKDGTLVREVDSGGEAVYTTYFDAKGKNVVISTASAGVKAINVETGDVTVVDTEVGYVHNFDFSRDGRYMCGPAPRGGIIVWDARTWKEVRRLEGHSGSTSFASLSPDGRHVASSGADGSVRLWEVASGRQVAVLAENLGGGGRLKFSEDGRTLTVNGADGNVRVFGLPGTRLKPAAFPKRALEPGAGPDPVDEDE